MSAALKVILALALLLCLLPMPYGYFQLVRFVATAGFAFLAFRAGEQKKEPETFVFIMLAVLFQPFEKVALGRIGWNLVDLLVAVSLLYSVFASLKKAKTS